jgi:hypothetical protein
MAGLKQVVYAMLGKTIREEESPATRIVSSDDNVDSKDALPEKDTVVKDEKSHYHFGFKKTNTDGSKSPPTKDKYGVTESEWETAQRATRTATWGKSNRTLVHDSG